MFTCCLVDPVLEWLNGQPFQNEKSFKQLWVIRGTGVETDKPSLITVNSLQGAGHGLDISPSNSTQYEARNQRGVIPGLSSIAKEGG